MINFDWDENKNKANIKKHGVSFQEAVSVFYDCRAVEFFDDTHSDDEDRFIMLGFSKKARLLVVCHCLRENETKIRIISARPATKNESQYYKR